MAKCNHEPCSCETTGNRFCSTQCAQQAQSGPTGYDDAASTGRTRGTCGCPHDDCGGHEKFD